MNMKTAALRDDAERRCCVQPKAAFTDFRLLTKHANAKLISDIRKME